MSKKLNLGDMVLVTVDPRSNNGSDTAAAQVVRVLDVKDEKRVNLRVLLDGDGNLLLRNVPVLDKEPDEDDEDAPSVYALHR